ncbi:MAG: hypothetical protein WEC59_11430 [Salibacteraceae bacterium]
MSFAENILKRLFSKDEKSKTVLDKGIIKRSPAWLEAFENWRATKGDHTLLEIKRNLVLSKRDLRDDLHFVLLTMTNAKGFRFHLSGLGIDSDHDQFVLELLKQRCENIGYQLSNSFYEYHEKQSVLNREEWYYLKPPLSNFTKEPPFNQLFGNVKIELQQNEHRTLKVLVTTYTDRSYKEALSFEDFMSELLD